MPDFAASGSDSQLYVGVLSGTSVDALSLVLADLGTGPPRLVAWRDEPIDPELREQLVALCSPGEDEVRRLGEADRRLGEAIARAVLSLLDQAGVDAGAVRAIGSHGQTIRHQPPRSDHQRPAFSLQIGDPNTIVLLGGITTVADFRRRDIAAGGQAAPLATAFHRVAFGDERHRRLILNLGGIANLTLLDGPGQRVQGFDTGPANLLLDGWNARHGRGAYDEDGRWGRQGHCQEEFLKVLLAHPFLAELPPKSTGREEFHMEWLDACLAKRPVAEPADVQRTLVELTAVSVAEAVDRHASDFDQLYACGGGACNGFLMERLAARLAGRQVDTTRALGLDPVRVEGMTFAWLAQQALTGRPGNIPDVTGARTPCILGAIYPP